MIAVYNGFEYKYVSNRRNKEIIANIPKEYQRFYQDLSI